MFLGNRNPYYNIGQFRLVWGHDGNERVLHIPLVVLEIDRVVTENKD